jgi:hypothetical protein
MLLEQGQGSLLRCRTAKQVTRAKAPAEVCHFTSARFAVRPDNPDLTSDHAVRRTSKSAVTRLKKIVETVLVAVLK